MLTFILQGCIKLVKSDSKDSFQTHTRAQEDI